VPEATNAKTMIGRQTLPRPRSLIGVSLVFLLLVSLGFLVPGAASATSLQFFGNGDNGIDRVTIQIDPQVPSDVGATDFTLEWWMRALPGENASDDVTCGANGGWTLGNVVFDRNIFNVPPASALNGAFGVSLTGGHVAFGVSAGTAGNTICGQIDVTDGVWHHVAVTRQKSDGRLRIYVDGALDAEGDDNVGDNKDISYLNNQITSHPDTDPFLIIGAEKQDASPAYHGWIDEIRLSTVQRYTSDRFTRPFSVFALDGSTAALYHLDEGAGDTIGDAAGGSPGTRAFGGSPAGPEWSSNGAPLDTARKVQLEQVASGLSSPVTIANAGDDRLFVVEQTGRIRVYRVNSSGPLTPLGTFLDIHDIVTSGSERGLLGLAFHPDYATNGFFFVYYTSVAIPGAVDLGDVVIARYHTPTPSDNTADALSGVTLLTIDHSTFGNHNAGGIAFGPDGYLYIPVGDGGSGGDPFGNGQNLQTHLGKILRIDVDVPVDPAPHYEIPPDNPFVSAPPGAKKEIWAFGLRNPWRISFDRLSGDLFIGDVGQDSREELDLQLAGGAGGANYGWSRMEGIACYPPGSGCSSSGITLPILDYTHSEGCAITGGYRYRGAGIPTLNGVYVFTDYCGGIIWGGVQAANGAWSRVQLMSSGLSISTFGEDAWGELYAAHLGGSIHRFARVRPRLTVTRSGVGIGTVNGPGGIACGNVCTAEFEPGESVTLTTAIDPNSWLAGWSGACGGAGDCTVVMNGDRSVTVTINPRSVFQFSAPTYTVTEGNAAATITVQRLAGTAGTARVNYAIEAGTATAPPATDADFSGPVSGTLTFNSGESVKTFTVPIVNDTRAEGPETILLSLHHYPQDGSILGNQATAVLTIVDNDAGGTVQFGQTAYSTSEASGSFAVPLQRSGGSADVSVTWTVTGDGTAQPGIDFVTPNGQLTGTIPIPANVSGASLLLTLLRQTDTLASGPRTIKLTLSNPQPAGFLTLGPHAATTLTMTDDDSAGALQFSPASLTVAENVASGKASLTVTRNQTASGVGVSWAVVTAESTAVLGTDYGGPTSGTLAFGSGVLSQPIEIPLLNPAGVQGTRTLKVRLSNPKGGASLGPQSTATVTITDSQIGLEFNQASYTTSEGSGSAMITVARTGPTQTPASVNFATGAPSGGLPAQASASSSSCTPQSNYRPVSGMLTFGAGETSKSFSVPLCLDGVVGPGPRVLGLTLATPQPTGVASLGHWATADLTINNVDAGGVLTWSPSAYSVNEGSGQVVLTVNRSGGSAGAVTVDYAITGGSATAPPGVGADFGGPLPTGSLTGTLQFGPSVMSQTITIPIVNDSEAEPNETFTVALQNPQGGASVGILSVATVTILDNDRLGTVQFTQSAMTVAESAPSVGLTVSRSGSTGNPAAVNYQITGATAAVNGSLTGTLAFPSGSASQPLTIPLLDDTVIEGTRMLTVTLKSPVTGGFALGSPSVAVVTLVDDEGTVQFAGPTFTVSESSGSATITLTRTGGMAKPTTVHFATGDAGDTATPALTPTACSPGADYRPIGDGSLTFNAGETTRTFSVGLCEDSLVDTPNPETFTVKLVSVTAPASIGAQGTAVVHITDDDAGGVVQWSSSTYSTTEGNSTASLIVLRSNGGASAVTVPWSISGTAVAGTDFGGPTNGQLQFGANQPSASLQIPILDDSAVDGVKTVVVTLGTPGGGASLGSPSVATLTIADNEPSVRFSSDSYSVNESSTGASVMVTRGGSTGSTVSVDVKTTATGTASGGGSPCAAGADFTAVTLHVTFNPGETVKTVTLPLCPDTAVESTESIGLVLSNVTGATLATPSTATVQILNDDVGGAIQFGASVSSLNESQGTASLPLVRTGGSASGARVHWTVAGGSAVAGIDYTGPANGWLPFGFQQMTQSIPIQVLARPGTQGPRSITLQLDNADGGGTLGAQTTSTLWIVDAD
jgi:glucose/arabinose dehydrogenase